MSHCFFFSVSGYQKCLASNIFLNIFFSFPQKIESHTELEWYESDKWWQNFKF